MVQGARSKGDMDKIKAKEKEYSDKFLVLLTVEQAEKFEASKGKEFKFKG